jgi:general secretion pathway protein G
VVRSVGRDSTGFTLIEMLVVLAIVGTLLGIAIPSYISRRNEANDAVAKADLRVSIPSIEAYFTTHGTYAGITTDILRTSYDRALPSNLLLTGVSATSYCAETGVGSRSWKREGPGAPVVFGTC